MANRYPLIVSTTSGNSVQEIPAGDFLDLSQSGISNSGNISVSGIVSATGNITGSYFIGNGSALTGISAGSSYGNSNVVTLLAAFGSNSILTTGNITGSYFIGNGSQLTGLAATYGNSNVVTLLAAFGSNSISTTGNITAANLNSPTADLAEMYSADADYAPGTVVKFGGNQEITISDYSHCTQVAGIVSTSPSYLMNSAQAGDHVLPVALTGRVPCQVMGVIAKGDRLVSSNIAGVATTLDKTLYEPGCIIGKSLEEYNSSEPGVIEVAVGRF